MISSFTGHFVALSPFNLKLFFFICRRLLDLKFAFLLIIPLFGKRTAVLHVLKIFLVIKVNGKW